jgi:predicted Zn finger-like uncharacterized protein
LSAEDRARPPARLFTRCAHCRAALPLTVRELAEAGGMVRCGSCGRTLNAMSALYPAFPDDDAEPLPTSGMPPMLQPHVEQERIPEGDAADAADSDQRGPVLALDLEPDPPPKWARWLWPALALLLAVALALQLFGPERWRADVDWLHFGDPEPVPVADAVQLVSRDMHPHPSLDDAFIVSAVLINRHDAAVPWPGIELELFDASQQVVGRRRLVPSDYLADGADLDAGFGPGVRLPVVLEMSVDASRPAGFSMSFHY